MKINYKNILIVIIFSIAWLFTGPTILENFFNLEDNLRNFIPIASLSILGVILFMLKRHYEVNFHQVDSMEMLIVAITPTVASFTLLPVSDFGRILMPVFLVLITVFWFIYFTFIIKAKEFLEYEKNKKEQLFIKQTKRSTLVIFLFLIVLEIALFENILSFNTKMP